MKEYNFPNDYSHPNAIASKFEEIEGRLDEIESREQESEGAGDRSAYVWGFGTILAMILSWAKNGSILYCIGHGILSWVYVIYVAFIRKN
jgi:hypothetical protein